MQTPRLGFLRGNSCDISKKDNAMRTRLIPDVSCSLLWQPQRYAYPYNANPFARARATASLNRGNIVIKEARTLLTRKVIHNLTKDNPIRIIIESSSKPANSRVHAIPFAWIKRLMAVLSMRPAGKARLIGTWPDRRLISFRTRGRLIGKVSTFTLLSGSDVARTNVGVSLTSSRYDCPPTRSYNQYLIRFAASFARSMTNSISVFNRVRSRGQYGRPGNQRRMFYKHLGHYACMFNLSHKRADFYVNWVANIFQREIKMGNTAAMYALVNDVYFVPRCE